MSFIPILKCRLTGYNEYTYFSYLFAWGLLPLFQLGYIYVDGNPIGPDDDFIQKNFTLTTHDYYVGTSKSCYQLPQGLLRLKPMGVISQEQILVLMEKDKIYYIPCVEIVRCLYVSKPLYAESLLSTDGLTPYYESLDKTQNNTYEVVFNRNFHIADLYYKNILDFVFFITNKEVLNWRDSVYTKYADTNIIQACLPRFKSLTLIGSGFSIKSPNPYNPEEQYEHILVLNLQINNIPNYNYSISYWHPSILNINSTVQGNRTVHNFTEDSDDISITSHIAPHKGKAKQLEAKILSSHNYSDTASLKKNKYSDSASRMIKTKDEVEVDAPYSVQPSISTGNAKPLNISIEDREFQDFLSDFYDDDFIIFCKAIAFFKKLPRFQAEINYGILSLTKVSTITRLVNNNLPRRYSYAKIISPYGPILIFELCNTDEYYKSTILVRNATDFEKTVSTLVKLIIEDNYWSDKNLSKTFGNYYTPISHYANRSADRWFEIMLSHFRK